MVRSISAAGLLLRERLELGLNAAVSGFEIVGLVGLMVVYFLPSVVAYARNKRNAGAILILNLLLGWTFVGWVVSLVWAASKD